MLLNLIELTQCLKNGHLEDARKQLLRYGTVIDTADREDNTGAHRTQTIAHYNRRYTITMHNGQVKEISSNGEIYTPAA